MNEQNDVNGNLQKDDPTLRLEVKELHYCVPELQTLSSKSSFRIDDPPDGVLYMNEMLKHFMLFREF